jgi:hypothetical protein
LGVSNSENQSQVEDVRRTFSVATMISLQNPETADKSHILQFILGTIGVIGVPVVP